MATANEEAEVSGARGTALPTIALLVLKKTGGGSGKRRVGRCVQKRAMKRTCNGRGELMRATSSTGL